MEEEGEGGGGGDRRRGGDVEAREERTVWVASSFSRSSCARSFRLSGVGRPLREEDEWGGWDVGGRWVVAGERVPAPMPR